MKNEKDQNQIIPFTGGKLEQEPLAPQRKTDPPFLPMLHGRSLDDLSAMPKRNPLQDIIGGTNTITSGSTTLVINGTQLSFRVSTHKLLSAAAAAFTQNNHTGHGDKDRQMRDLRVYIPLKEYARLCGFDIDTHPTSTPEEEARERKRAKDELRNARKKIRADLQILQNATLSWSEKVRGKQGDFLDVNLVQEKGIKDGFIYIMLGNRCADYLVQLPIGQYPLALLGVDERNNNAYAMGYQMAMHYSKTSNHNYKTADRLKVSTLLKYTTLPSADSTTVKRKGWATRIKEPFENSLDALTACGLLESWEYCKPKGEALNNEDAETWENLNEAIEDDKARAWDSFNAWANTLVRFTLKNAPPIKKEDLTEKTAADPEEDTEK